jgi:hypothetical protein
MWRSTSLFNIRCCCLTNSTKYKYEGDTGTGFYEIEPIRNRKEKYKIYCDMQWTDAAQSVFYLNGIKNNHIYLLL